MERRLAAILLTDMVGYSRLMGLDEEGTIARQKTHREEVIDPRISILGGRIVKTTGDGVLVEFSSVLDAVKCAVEMQTEFASRDTDVPEDRRIQYRIGINLGDIVIDGDDIIGDGVNIAARLEGLAKPGGICVTDTVYEQVRDKLDIQFRDLGPQQVKNIARPIRVWQWTQSGVSETTNLGNGDTPELPEKPSIAVLPFENMSIEKQHEFFGTGLAEEIITTLSKIPYLFVIARNSSFSYTGKALDLRQVGRELGVRYILEGSVRASGERIRVTAQLVNATTGQQIWADRYDRRLEDVFAIQDDVTREIVTALRIKLADGEQAQIWLRGTESVEAWSYVMSAFDLMLQATPESMVRAGRLLSRAVTADPNYAEAYAMSGLVEWLERHYGFRSFDQESINRIGELSRKSLDLNPNLGVGHFTASAYALETGEYEEARQAGSRAVSLTPNDALIRALYARILIESGNPEDAESQMRIAMRFNPFYPSFYYGLLANALEQQERNAEAIELLQTAVQRDRDYFSGHIRLASLLGLSGRKDDAHHHLLEAQRINPRFNSAALASYYRSPDPKLTARFREGLKKAGMVLD